MTFDEEEQRQPLLAVSEQQDDPREHLQQQQQQRKGFYSGLHDTITACFQHTTSSWRVYEIVMLYFLYELCYIGPISAQIELVRDLSCARYYEFNPSLIGQSPLGQQERQNHPCSADTIEQEASRIILAIDMLSGFASAFAMLYFGKRLATWGRRPILLISILPPLVVLPVYIAVPRGYPYGPLAPDSLISPSHCIYLIILVNILSGLLGGLTLIQCCLRLLMVDNSTATNRTRHLMYIQVSIMTGIMFGPLLFGYVSYVFPISSYHVDSLLQVIFKYVLVRVNPSASLANIQQSFQQPSTPDLRDGHGNVTPFVVGIIGGTLSLVYVALFVQEPARNEDALDEENDEEVSPTPKKAEVTSPIRALMPMRRADGQLDWRIPSLIAAYFFHLSGGMCLGTVLLFFGHSFEWGPVAVDWLLSSLGAARLLVIFFVLPGAVLFLEKKVRRPLPLQHLSIDEIKEIAKGSSAEETPAGESAFVSEQDLHDKHLLQGAISLWRARLDRIIVRVSWSFDILSWGLISLGALLWMPDVMLAGIVVLGLGVGASPAFQSLGVAVASDVFASTTKADDHSPEQEEEQASSTKAQTSGHAGEVFFALMSLAESANATVMPLVNNLIYSSTLSLFPPAPFLTAILYYSAAVLAVSTIQIHR